MRNLSPHGAILTLVMMQLQRRGSRSFEGGRGEHLIFTRSSKLLLALWIFCGASPRWYCCALTSSAFLAFLLCYCFSIRWRRRRPQVLSDKRMPRFFSCCCNPGSARTASITWCRRMISSWAKLTWRARKMRRNSMRCDVLPVSGDRGCCALLLGLPFLNVWRCCLVDGFNVINTAWYALSYTSIFAGRVFLLRVSKVSTVGHSSKKTCAALQVPSICP